MKLKSLILLSLLLIPSISFASQIGSTTANQNQVLGFDLTNGQAGDFVGISWINYSSNNVFEITSRGNGNWTYNNGNPYNNIYQLVFSNGYSKGIFFWNNGKLVFHTNFNGTFNYSPTLEVKKFAKVSATDIGNFTNYSFDFTLDDVLNSNISFTHQIFAAKRGNDGSVVNSSLTLSSRMIYCLGDGSTYYCASCVPGTTDTNSSCNGGTSVIDLGLTKGSTIADIQSLGLNTNSPVSNSTQFYYSTGSCPSVGQLKANSNLIPAVCYGGYGSDVIYTAGDSTPFVGGSGLDVFQVYNLTSGGMQLQTWYDTYWVYYNHISSDPTPFYNKPKALLGLQLARQLGSQSGIKGSSSILNYCYYVVNNIPDNTSTCVGSNVSTVYSGFKFTDLDREDALESIIGWQDSVRIQSGFDTGDLTDIYNQSYSLFSSWTVDPGFDGILPSYIVIGFLGIVLLYFLRR